jgi:carbon-monoxide dehydrogenase medium subunit
MKAPPFAYVRPVRVAEACAFLADDDNAQVLAGGQSLMATLNMRLAQPSLIVDINWIEDFVGIEKCPRGGLRVGALVRHNDIAQSSAVAHEFPLLHLAIRHVAHPAIRYRGTHCGSLALADPSAEMPACAVALSAEIVLASASGSRRVPAAEYFMGPYETPRTTCELLVEVHYPPPLPGLRSAFGEIARRHGDFPQIGFAATARVAGGVFRDLGVVVFGCEPAPRRLQSVADYAEGMPTNEPAIVDIARVVAEEIKPIDHGSVRRVQALTLATQILRELAA